MGDDTKVGRGARVAAGLLTAAAAAGSYVYLFLVLIQLDPDACGYLAERDCTPEELRFEFDAALTLIGLVLALGSLVFGAGCAFRGRRRLGRYALACFAGAAVVGLLLEILDIPNR